ncbi:hypothetical protein LVY72_05030 [Arthrobacter sp. I2-34]|uniref:Uncharacterized protein n=1 Tax=Arthrobacter hankyongi TaxID=2904801 RepID=A0ABS9L3T1_9MICC|nr:hypothetical protein [Arthrobacter hankyongi]MCG2621275.1 hypothetical protein [Arthrobacter hankyongi]
MDNESTELGIYVDGDVMMIVGHEDDIDHLIAQLSAGSGLKSRALTRDALAAVAGLAGMAPGTPAGGRWVRLTPDAAARFGGVAGTDKPHHGVVAGILRGPKGRTGQELKFIMPGGGTPSPLRMSNAAAMAMSMAIQVTVEDLANYLETMDVTPDQLLQDGRAEAMGDASGTTRNLSEAFDRYQQTGRVSPESWETVQQSPAQLASLAARSLAQLDSLADKVSQGSVAEKAKAVQQVAGDELPYWLSMTAVSLIDQKRFHILEIARGEQEHPEDADARRDAVARHHQAMGQSIARTLQRLTRALEQAGRVSDLDRVFQPISAADLVQAVNQAHEQIGRFVSIAQIGPLAWLDASQKDWSKSVADVAQKGSDAVGGAVKGLFAGVRGVAERAILEQAKRIQAEQAARKAHREPGKDVDLRGPDRG